MNNARAKATLLLLAGLVVLLAAIPARAQTLMRVNIPFDFLAGEKVNPAGEYFIKVNPEFLVADLRSVNSTNTSRVALGGYLPSHQGQDLTKAFLRFRVYGSAYALEAIGAPTATSGGYTVRPSKAEPQLAKATGGAAVPEVTLVQ